MSRTTLMLAVLTGTAVAVAAGVVIARRSSGGDSERGPIESDSIVMLGDSITAEGQWNVLLPDQPVVNRGQSGFTTQQLVPVAREVATAQPRTVFILTGTNDIRDDRPPSWTSEHLGAILDLFESGAPDTDVVVQTVLPRADASEDVRLANAAIEQLVSERDVQLLDLHAEFDDGAGGLRPDETTDGVHLSQSGYGHWADLLSETLRGQSANE